MRHTIEPRPRHGEWPGAALGARPVICTFVIAAITQCVWARRHMVVEPARRGSFQFGRTKWHV